MCKECTRQVCELGVVNDEATRFASTASLALNSLSRVIRMPSTSWYREGTSTWDMTVLLPGGQRRVRVSLYQPFLK